MEGDFFSGKRVVVTGASAGIGAEFCRQLHKRGALIVAVARREARLQELKNELGGSDESFVVEVADLTEASDLGRIAEVLRTGDIDLLINNAGRGSFGFFDELPVEEEIQMIRLNIEAPLVLARAIIPHLKKKRSGGLITLASIAAFQPLPFMSTYAATKAFDLFHSLGLRQELKKFGVRSLAVCPGPVGTEFGGVARVPGTITGGPRDMPPEVVKESLRAYERDKDFVIPCLRAKAMAVGSRVLPYAVTTPMVAKGLSDVREKS